MKKKLLFLIFIITLQSLCAKTLLLNDEEKAFLKQNPTLKIGYSVDFEPLYIQNGDGSVEGIIPDLYSLIEKKLGIKFIYITKKWIDVLQDAKEGNIDIVPMMSPRTAQQFNLLTTNKIYTHLFRVYGKKERQFDINSLEDLKGLKVTYAKNVLILDGFLKKYKNDIELIGVDSSFEAFEKVLNNKADIAVVFNSNGNYLIKKNFLNQLEPLYLLKDLQIFSVAGINSKNRLLYSILTKALDSIHYEDKLQIINHWTQLGSVNQTTKSQKNILNKEEKKYLENKKFVIYNNAKGWHPFIFPEDGDIKGISVDMWSEIVKYSNLRYEYESIDSFNQILNLFKTNTNAILTSTSATKDREEYASFTKPYASFPIGIATNIKEDFLINLKNLEGKSVAVGKNYTAHKLLQKYYPKINFIPVKNIQEALHLLANEKVYAAADILPVLNYELNRFGFTNLKISGTSNFNFDVQIMVNKENSQLVPILNKLIDNMDENKKQEIINKWLHTTYRDKIDYTLVYLILFTSLLIIIFISYRQQILRQQKKKIEQEVYTATKKLKELNNLHEDTQRLAKIATIKKDIKTAKYWVSKEFFSIFEIDINSYVTTSLIMSRIHIEDKKRLTHFFKQNEKYQGSNVNQDSLTIKIDTPSQGIKYIDIYLSYLFDENNKPIERKATIQDVTDRTLSKLEKDKQDAILVQQSKLASMGEMIGAIAHQWRQPLNELSIRIQKLKYNYAKEQIDEAFIKEFINKNKNTIDFMSKTIDDFRNFFRIDKQKVEFSVPDVIDEVLNIMNAQLRNHHILVVIDYDDCKYSGYKTEFQQVLINIITNSKDALVQNNIQNPNIQIDIKENIIKIKDNGGGIPQNVIARVFEPYFTTKPQGEGTGIGLYMAKMIIEDNMGGKIKIENENDGVLITIDLKGNYA